MLYLYCANFRKISLTNKSCYTSLLVILTFICVANFEEKQKIAICYIHAVYLKCNLLLSQTSIVCLDRQLNNDCTIKTESLKTSFYQNFVDTSSLIFDWERPENCRENLYCRKMEFFEKIISLSTSLEQRSFSDAMVSLVEQI